MQTEVNGKHKAEVDTMNKIMELLENHEFESQERIMTWVQSKIELDWDE